MQFNNDFPSAKTIEDLAIQDEANEWMPYFLQNINIFLVLFHFFFSILYCFFYFFSFFFLFFSFCISTKGNDILYVRCGFWKLNALLSWSNCITTGEGLKRGGKMVVWMCRVSVWGKRVMIEGLNHFQTCMHAKLWQRVETSSRNWVIEQVHS